MESYSLDIIKKVSEDRKHPFFEGKNEIRCSSCNHYVEEIALKEAK
jgi:hypothetical protein